MWLGVFRIIGSCGFTCVRGSSSLRSELYPGGGYNSFSLRSEHAWFLQTPGGKELYPGVEHARHAVTHLTPSLSLSSTLHPASSTPVLNIRGHPEPTSRALSHRRVGQAQPTGPPACDNGTGGPVPVASPHRATPLVDCLWYPSHARPASTLFLVFAGGKLDAGRRSAG